MSDEIPMEYFDVGSVKSFIQIMRMLEETEHLIDHLPKQDFVWFDTEKNIPELDAEIEVLESDRSLMYDILQGKINNLTFNMDRTHNKLATFPYPNPFFGQFQ